MSDSIITSRQNQRVKDAAKLRQRKFRQQTQQTLVDGVREISRAILANVKLVEVFVCPRHLSGPRAEGNRSYEEESPKEGTYEDDAPNEAQKLVQRIKEQGAQISNVTPEVFEKIAFGERTEGIVAVVSTPQTKLADLPSREKGIIAVLEGVEKPGNLGAILRTADAAGINSLIVAEGRTDLYNPAAIRASLGTIFSVPTATATSQETLKWLREMKIPILATRPDGSAPHHEIDMTQGAAIVLGSEAEGLSDTWLAEDIQPVRLPMLGVADSLNVSATAAVLFYEALRQKSKCGNSSDICR